MNKTLVICTVLSLVCCDAWAQQSDSAVSQLEIENKMLKTQIAALEKKLKGSSATEVSTGSTATKQPASEPAAGSVGEGLRVTQSFAIHESNPAWWKDAEAFVFELALRELVADRFPQETPDQLLKRRRYFEGVQVDWELRIDSVEAVTSAQAGKDYQDSVNEIEEQKKRIAELKGSPRSTAAGTTRGQAPARRGRSTAGRRPSQDRSAATTSEDRAERREQLRQAELRLKELEAKSRQLQQLMGYEDGGAMLTASYRPSGQAAAGPRRSSNPAAMRRRTVARSSGGSQGGIEITMALDDKEAAKLAKYQEAKSAQYEGQSGWPIRIAGKVQMLRYEDNTVRAIIDGTWRSAPGGGNGQSAQSSSSRRDLRGAGRSRNMERMGPPSGMDRSPRR